MAQNVTMVGCGTVRDPRYLLHDRDTKYTISVRATIESGRVKTLPLPARMRDTRCGILGAGRIEIIDRQNREGHDPLKDGAPLSW